MASPATKSDNTISTKRPIPPAKEGSEEISAMLLPSLYRLTEGLPRKELKMMISEAMICEEALENEIRQLQEALESPPDSDAAKKPSLQMMLDSDVTPPDRFFTVSSLLGRLRDDLATPLPPNSTLPALRANAGLAPPPPKKKKKENNPVSSTDPPAVPSALSNNTPPPSVSASTSSTTLEKQKKVLSLYQLPEYTKEHVEPNALMALWKKISSHRSSIVFRRPVANASAPGYQDRINFPMDLSLIRKMIVARQIRSYSDLHQRLGLICHNCVKYNGRESDYGIVTRDFESNADEMVVAAVFAATHEARNPKPKSAATPPPTATALQPTAAVKTPLPPAPTNTASDAIKKTDGNSNIGAAVAPDSRPEENSAHPTSAGGDKTEDTRQPAAVTASEDTVKQESNALVAPSLGPIPAAITKAEEPKTKNDSVTKN